MRKLDLHKAIPRVSPEIVDRRLWKTVLIVKTFGLNWALCELEGMNPKPVAEFECGYVERGQMEQSKHDRSRLEPTGCRETRI